MARSLNETWYHLEGSVVLLIAAVLCLFIPSYPTAIVLLLVLVKGSSFSWLLSRQRSKLVQRLEQLLPAIKPRTTSAGRSLIHQKVHRYTLHAMVVTALAEILLLVIAGLAGFNVDTSLTLVVGLAVALTPSGLWLKLTLATHHRGAKSPATLVRRALIGAFSDSITKTVLLVLGVAGLIIGQIPVAITALQLLILTAVLQVLPASVLVADARALEPRVEPHEPYIFGALAAAVIYANYLLFFVRHHVSPAHLDSANFLYSRASALTLVTLLCCQFINLLLRRIDDRQKFFTAHLWSNPKLYAALAGSLAICAVILYVPAINGFFGTGPLTVWDWLTALLAAAVYLSARLLQRHTRQHSRRAVLQLHRELTRNFSTPPQAKN